MAKSVSGSRPIRSGRRTRAEMDALRDALCALLEAEGQMTVRQCYYRLVAAGLIEKTEGEYKATVVRLLGEMRLSGRLSYAALADNTRWMRRPTTYASLASALRRTVEAYRRSVWDSQAVHVELWVEKDALAGVLYSVTNDWDVPLMVTRGYASLTYLHGAAEAMQESGRPAYVYFFGDYDPSGLDIQRIVESRLREMAPGLELTFTAVAVTPGQIERFGLPTRPTKRSDSRSRQFAERSVELDALPPDILRDLAERCITQHIDQEAYDRLVAIEQAERETLSRFLGAWSGG